MKDWLIEHKFYVLAVVIITFGGGYYFYGEGIKEPPANQSFQEVDNSLQVEVKEGENKDKAKVEQLEKIMVDVKGQIKQPGVYLSNSGERVIDVIGRAGGLTDQADQSQVNFAEHVQDEMVIYIPAKGEEGLTASGPSGGSTAVSGGSGHNQAKINLNKADETGLQNLPGIGPAKAKAIIEYRNSSGPFKAVEELKNITGIGDKTFDKLKDLIDVH